VQNIGGGRFSVTDYEIYAYIIRHDTCIGIDCDNCPIRDCSDPVGEAIMMIDDITGGSDSYCQHCNGSGLDRFRASICRECNGSGIEA